MVKVAILSKVRPLKNILTNKDYQKLDSIYMVNTFLPRDKYIIPIIPLYCRTMTYITRPLKDHEIMAMKLSYSNTDSSSFKYHIPVNCIIYNFTNSEYKSLMSCIKECNDLKEEKTTVSPIQKELLIKLEMLKHSIISDNPFKDIKHDTVSMYHILTNFNDSKNRQLENIRKKVRILLDNHSKVIEYFNF